MSSKEEIETELEEVRSELRRPSTPEELERWRRFNQAVDRIRVRVKDFDVVEEIRKMRGPLG